MVVLGNIKYTPDHDNEMERRADVHPKQKSNEMSLVIEAYTVTNPRAMVIKFEPTCFALPAMMCSWRFVMFTILAVSGCMCALFNFHTVHRTNIRPLEHPKPSLGIYPLCKSIFIVRMKIAYPAFRYTSRRRYNT